MLKLFFCAAIAFEVSQLPWCVARAKYPITGSDHPYPYYSMWQFQLLFCSNQRISRPSNPSGKPIYRVKALLKPQVHPMRISLPFSNFSQAAKLSPASMLIKSLSAVSSSSASDGAFIVTRFRATTGALPTWDNSGKL